MAEDFLKELIAKFDEIKDEVEKLFGELGFGKDQVGRAHDAVDVAKAVVASSGVHGGHDLNDDLAAAGEQVDQSEVAEPGQNPERRTGSADTPEPELKSSDPVLAKDAAETPVAPVAPVDSAQSQQ